EQIERRLRTHVVVAIDDVDALARFDLDRYDLFDEATLFPRFVGELLAPERVAILLLTCNAVFGGAVLGRHRHRAAAVRIEQRFPEIILELSLSEFEAGSQSPNYVRRLAHALDATSQHEVGLAELNHLRAADRGLNPRPAQAVHGQRRHVHRYAGLERHVAGAIDCVGA